MNDQSVKMSSLYYRIVILYDYMNYKTLPIDLGQNGFSLLSSAHVIVEENIPAIVLYTHHYTNTRASARRTLF